MVVKFKIFKSLRKLFNHSNRRNRPSLEKYLEKMRLVYLEAAKLDNDESTDVSFNSNFMTAKSNRQFAAITMPSIVTGFYGV